MLTKKSYKEDKLAFVKKIILYNYISIKMKFATTYQDEYYKYSNSVQCFFITLRIKLHSSIDNEVRNLLLHS